MGLGQHLWNLTTIPDGPGEERLAPLLLNFQPHGKSLEDPTHVELIHSSITFFRNGVAVQVINLGRPSDSPQQKRCRSAMDLAGKIDQLLIADSTTLESVIHVDAISKSNPAEHPLMCRPDGDYPEGSEMCFRRRESAGPVHAVFPKGVAAPENPEGAFVLHGHFQGIQN